MLQEAVSAVGAMEDSDQVRSLVDRLQASERFDDPPFRHYLIASQNGVSLLFERGCLIALQIYVEPTRKRNACPLALPYGLTRGMTRVDVHGTLGQPAECDEFQSRYFFESPAVLVVGEYNDASLLKYLCVERTYWAVLAAR